VVKKWHSVAAMTEANYPRMAASPLCCDAERGDRSRPRPDACDSSEGADDKRLVLNADENHSLARIGRKYAIMPVTVQGVAMRKIFSDGVILLCLLTCSSFVPALAKVTPRSQQKISSALRFALSAANDVTNAEGKRASDVPRNARYICVTFGSKDYIYNRNGRRIKTRAAKYPSAGLMGNYAEIGWDLLDSKMKIFSDTYGYYLLRFKSQSWHRLSTYDGSGRGYGNLKEVGVPAQVIKSLKLG
jgi:hypothetical protein